MACDCEQYINCDDKGVEVGSYSNESTYGHSVTNITTIDNHLQFTHKTTRNFSVDSEWDRPITISHILTGCGENKLMCDNHLSATPSCNVSDYCSIEKNVPYFWDEYRGIYVWKYIKEVLNIGVSSNKTAAFRMKWGTSAFHKVCILNTTKVSGKEQFLMLKGGVQSVLAEVEYSYNPFPSDGSGSVWGLYGNTITRSAQPDTENVACILIFPTVPKLATPYDNDVIHYGFYDYNATDGGFTETSLPKDDGGKDYFYPYWCRQMPFDTLWRKVADQRYDVIYSKGTMDLSGHRVISPIQPEVWSFPFGSFSFSSKDDFVASCLLQFGDRTGGKGAVFNDSSISDLLTAIKTAGIPMDGSYSTAFPVSPL